MLALHEWRFSEIAPVERELALGSVLPQLSSLIEEAIWIPERGIDLFPLLVEHDLEGIVAKRRDGVYSPSAPWLKIKNPRYSQAEGRGELFKYPDADRRISWWYVHSSPLG